MVSMADDTSVRAGTDADAKKRMTEVQYFSGPVLLYTSPQFIAYLGVRKVASRHWLRPRSVCTCKMTNGR